MRNPASAAGITATSIAGLAAAAAGARPGLAASPTAWQHQLALDPAGAVGLAAATLLWVLIGLVTLGVAATVLGQLPGTAGRLSEALSRRLLPLTLRRIVHLLIGVTVGMTALAPAGAWAAGSAAVPAAGSTSRVTATAQPAERLPVETLPSPYPELGEPAGPVQLTAPASPHPQVSRPRPTAKTPTAAVEVVVVPGDSLWSLAASSLAAHDAGAAASETSIAAEWPRWWAANRAAIGADPDLLIPGERLRPPA